MTNQVVSYVPKRDRFGKFKSISWRKLAKKVILYQLIALSVVLNGYFIRQLYVFRCSGGGMLMTGAKCDEIVQNKFAALELARQQVLINNPDLQ